MDKSLIATRSVQINSTPEKIWGVLTKPEKIKTYLFGTEVHRLESRKSNKF